MISPKLPKTIPILNRPNTFGNLAIFFYCVSAIFYIFPSGMPQPSDILIAIAVLCYFVFFLARRMSKISSLAILTLGFGFYAFTVNMVHYAFLPDSVFFKSSLYYLFNASVMLFVVSLFKRNPDTVSQILYLGVIVAVVLEFLFILFISAGAGSSRIIGTFNNPNQLALWSLLAACLLVVLRSKTRLGFTDFLLLLALGYIQTLSLSKAGIICFALLFLSLPFFHFVSVKIKIAFVIAAIVLGILSASNFQTFGQALENFDPFERTLARLATIGTEADESLEGRNYTRILNYPEFLLLGAGEGGYARFSGPWHNLELHSSLGTIAFSYGIIGMGLFLSILYVVSGRNHLCVAVMIFIILLYGLTHQSARFTDFWVFLGAAYGMRYVRVREEGEAALLPPAIQTSKGLSISQ
jgi:hypothetical protein